MAIIDGINVAVYNCDKCEASEMWIFRGQDQEGYKIACVKCGADQRELLAELGLSYLWQHKELEPP